ncbi:serpin [Acrasis kona]|uniref:Serpin n=1 Tax=Acrasis kona TaxID=1008807 RepID=A0AAW2ZM62_9EUKA
MSQQQFSQAVFSKIIANKPNDNVVISPYSIFIALLMTAAGAKSDTLQEMLSALCVQDQNKQNADVPLVLEKIASTKSVSSANAIFASKDINLLEEYKKVVSEQFKSEIEQKEYYFSDSTKSTNEVNDWVKDKTQGLIKSIVDNIDPKTALILVNAIYFKASWEKQFDKSLTKRSDFRLIGNSEKINVEMMFKYNKKVLYGENDNTKWVRLPYVGGELNSIFILPKSDDCSSSSLQETCEFVLSCLGEGNLSSKLRTSDVELTTLQIPRHKVEYEEDLVPVMKQLGMIKAFGSADLSGIGEGPADLSISKIVHKAVVMVDEQGTEAAAVTAVAVTLACFVNKPVYNFICDRPFLHVIEHSETGTVLFMAKVMKPDSKEK